MLTRNAATDESLVSHSTPLMARSGRTPVQATPSAQDTRNVGFQCSLAERTACRLHDHAAAVDEERWRRLSGKKLAELQETMDRLARTQEVLRRMEQCQCSSLAVCGERFLSHTK